MNPGRTSPAIFGHIGVDLDRSTFIVGDNKVGGGSGNGLIDGGFVFDFDLGGFDFTGVKGNFKARRDGRETKSALGPGSDGKKK